MHKTLLTFLLTFFLFAGMAQENDCACCSKKHQAFHFWLGDWNVYDTLGNWIGENNIVLLQDGCILQENWKSPRSTGSSYNYYNKNDDTWNQVWVDNAGDPLVLKGQLIDGKMVLRSEPTDSYSKVTWENNLDGTVTQIWEVFDINDRLLKVAFKGIYKKK